MASGASNSDVQYVAYLKAKFNLADADLLQVISLSQKSTQELPGAPEGEEIEEVIEESEEEEKVEVDGMMDASAYEEVIDEESYEESYEEEVEEDVEYVEHSATPSPAPAPFPVPAPVPSPQTASTSPDSPDPDTSPDVDPTAQATMESPSSQLAYSTPTPDGEIVEDPAMTQALVPVEDAPDDELAAEQQLVETTEEEVAPSVKYPEPVEPDPSRTAAAMAGAASEAPSDEVNALAMVPQTDEPPSTDPNALALVPAKPQGLVPVPEQAPPMDEEEAVPATKTTPPVQEDEESSNNNTIILAALCLLLIAIAVVLILIFGTETIPKWWENNPNPVIMEPYVPGNCNFEGQAQPNVVSQCNCNGAVTEVNDWTRQQYERLTTEFIVPTIYSSWDYTIDSCAPENKAMLWLSTGDVIEDQQTLTQRYTMAFFYYSTAGEQWLLQTDWMSEQNVCVWLGITCTGTEIQQLSLPSNRVAGPIPTELTVLTQLDTIALNQNNLQQSIPTDVFSLPNLRNLTLGTNQLTGTIPTYVGRSVQLEALALNSNMFRQNSTIPTELNGLTRLRTLKLEDNPQLTGRIASEYGLFTNLETLALSNTNIRSRIPTAYASLTRLQNMMIANTLVGGNIPSQFGRLTGLRNLDFTGSRFRQWIPSSLGLMTSLTSLSLGSNELTGRVPTQLGRLSRLSTLNLHANQLSGLVPSELGTLRSLGNLTLQGNPYLSGRMPEEICARRNSSNNPSGNLQSFVVDCPTREFGVVCPIPTCCSGCVDLEP